MRIAVVGAGVAGLSAAYLLDRAHEVELFESAPRAGGHANTLPVADAGRELGLDSGFVVYNDRNYPGFRRLLDELGVRPRASDMSFSVSCRRCALEYSGHGPAGLFAQRRNAVRPVFVRMLADLRRFFRHARAILDDPLYERATIGDYLRRTRYSAAFVDHYLAPMGAAIWSSSSLQMRDMPARFFVRFFDNHGLLGVRTAPRWHTIEGGSRSYVAAVLGRLRGAVHLDLPVRAVERHEDGVELVAADGESRRFDRVVLATHPDQALHLLRDPSDAERRALSRIPFSRNETVVHTAGSLLPGRRGARAAWNVSLDDCRARGEQVSVTYWLNRLQRLESETDYCVSLNQDGRIPEESVIARLVYEHPLFTLASIDAREELGRVNGDRRTDYCGAWLGNGFHEDGFRSGADVATRLGGGW